MNRTRTDSKRQINYKFTEQMVFKLEKEFSSFEKEKNGKLNFGFIQKYL